MRAASEVPLCKWSISRPRDGKACGLTCETGHSSIAFPIQKGTDIQDKPGNVGQSIADVRIDLLSEIEAASATRQRDKQRRRRQTAIRHKHAERHDENGGRRSRLPMEQRKQKAGKRGQVLFGCNKAGLPRVAA